MPRQPKRVDSAAVQGTESYIVIKPLTFGERRERFTVDELMARVIEWNWLDWDDEPLPLPHDDAARALLTGEETEFLLEQFGFVIVNAPAEPPLEPEPPATPKN